MEIKDHRLLLFIELYKELHGVTLSRNEAYEQASNLLQYVLHCIKPLAKIDEDDINNMSNESE